MEIIDIGLKKEKKRRKKKEKKKRESNAMSTIIFTTIELTVFFISYHLNPPLTSLYFLLFTTQVFL